MLKSVTLKNIGCFYDETIFSFDSSNYAYKNDFIKQVNGVELVNPIAIYGRNSSGKTTLLRAIADVMKMMIYDINELRSFLYHNIYCGQDDSSTVVFNLILEHGEYEYSITTQGKEIKDEKLIYNGKNLFEDIESELIENMPKLRQIGQEGKNLYISEVYDFIRNITYISSSRKLDGLVKYIDQEKVMLEKYANIRSNLEILEELPIASNIEIKEDIMNEEVFLLRFNMPGNIGFGMPLESTYLSKGTINTYKLLTLLESIKDFSLLLIDEFEVSLHPTLINKMIRMINEKKDIQLFFSTHNTNIMKNLRPDQIFFVKQQVNNHMISKIKRLSDYDFKIREGHNIEKLYYGGMFDEE